MRALQTAELVAAGLSSESPVEVALDLAPEGSARALHAAIRALPSNAAVMLVGHEPALSAIGTLLAGRELDALEKAQAARIVDGTARWRFAWDAEAPTVIAAR